MRQRVLFFDLARCVAAIAVIAIHVLAPYRHQYGVISFDEWFTAISINSISRWAVPVFILISGALMLSDRRPFDFQYYVKRRLGKVLVPFIIWSIFYAYLSGWSASGFDANNAQKVLLEGLDHATYYHLGFFYYFIPLYFVIPFLQIFVRRYDDKALYALTGLWLFTTALFLFRIDGVWSSQMWLYSGLLPLGYILYQKIPLTKTNVSLFVLLGVAAFAATIYQVVHLSMEADKYAFGRWLSYKTLNTVLAASMVFMVCRYFGEGLSAGANKVVGFISTHSLGIYILHPIFLWPMKEFGWYQGHPGWVIPLWIVISGGASLFASWLVSRSSKTAWLLP
ncbi:acyltransferase [Vibrio superstes]|uniref:Membrane protein n=1 Tax=Vibrio superstes NBRC 103154 TaxID=1219062 RepID=A0A511QW48_9VIBR|nr:acyltransferase family protein [Vibrio superstes]GEM81585.1 membrane protein [Vibrio superstes NBRC 103154]